ncbi:hypothetical protein KY285_035953 [Solanum tuberosum]|nr:hypothetical protein KY289_036109 [Solanum tuberosum]KAH0639367.1 hypothetical protein KY285_035953 [Solanum tuberosum]
MHKIIDNVIEAALCSIKGEIVVDKTNLASYRVWSHFPDIHKVVPLSELRGEAPSNITKQQVHVEDEDAMETDEEEFLRVDLERITEMLTDLHEI